MSRLTHDGTAKHVSRDPILRHERGQGNIDSLCSADHKQVWQSYPVDPYSDDFKYILYLYIQQYRYIWIICTMNAAAEPIHVLSVHPYHDTASVALLSSPVISTNEDQRIQLKCPGETWKYYDTRPYSRISVFLRTGTPQKTCKSYKNHTMFTAALNRKHPRHDTVDPIMLLPSGNPMNAIHQYY